MCDRLTLLFLLLSFCYQPTWAQGGSCNTAIPLNLNGAASNGTFTTACSNIPRTNLLSDNIQAGAPCSAGICSQELWFYLFPNDPTNQQNLDFQLTPNFNGNVKWVLLYSEAWQGSQNIPPQCGWFNDNSTNFTQRGSMCVNAIANTTYTFSPEGLDGSGTFLLLVQREAGTGGTVTVEVDNQTGNATCSAPTNDRCSAAASLTTPTLGGLGIDDMYAAGGSNTWDDAILGTTNCATKERILSVGGTPSQTSECISFAGSPVPTEDQYTAQDPFTFCYTDRTIGDAGWPNFLTFTSCVDNLDNTVFYTFTAPMTATDWYLHLGNVSCSWGQDTIQVLLASNVDCSDASNTTILGGNCGKIGASGLFPDPDGSFGPLTLISGQTYGIIIDGKQGAQCDFRMILTRTPTINPPLPVSFSSLEGEVFPDHQTVQWSVDGLEAGQQFVVERSMDGRSFAAVHQFPVQVDRLRYRYEDAAQGPGSYYYRIGLVEVNGTVHYSSRLRLERTFEHLLLENIRFTETALELQVLAPDARPLQVELLTLTGQTLLQQDWALQSGRQQGAFSTGDLSSGIYLVRVSQGNQVLVRKVVR